MWINCFRSILKGAVVTLFLFFLGELFIFVLKTQDAYLFAQHFMITFNALLVGVVTLGLFFFVRASGGEVLDQLKGILRISGRAETELRRLQDRATALSSQFLIAVPITLMGLFMFWKWGFPKDLSEFSSIYLMICAGLMWFFSTPVWLFLIFSLRIFGTIDHYSETGTEHRIEMRHSFQWTRDKMDDFFSICSFLSLFDVYFSFIALTHAFGDGAAGNPVLRSLLLIPLVVYLPFSLLYGFFPRYVLSRVFERDVMLWFEAEEKKLHAGEDFKLRLKTWKLLNDVREGALRDKRSLLFGVKDAPSLSLAFFIAVQFLFSSGLFKQGVWAWITQPKV